jgi:HNH endonuclease
MCELHYRRWFRANIAPTCSVEGCGKPVIARGWCAGHYNRWRKTGEPGTAEWQNDGSKAQAKCLNCERLVGPKGGSDRCPRCNKRLMDAAIVAQQIPCNVPGCTKLVKQAGVRMCGMHKTRLWKTGSVGPPESYIGPRGEGTIDPSGYRRTPVNGKHRLEHHVVMEAMLGRPLLPRENVHHKNGHRADNRPENLELWVRSQPAGQRVEDLVAFVVDRYPGELEKRGWTKAEQLAY